MILLGANMGVLRFDLAALSCIIRGVNFLLVMLLEFLLRFILRALRVIFMLDLRLLGLNLYHYMLKRRLGGNT